MPLLALLLSLPWVPFGAQGSAVTPPSIASEVVERSLHAMGTTCSLAVEGTSRSAAMEASEAAVAALEAVEARLSTWRPGSELARLNAAPVGSAVTPSPQLGDWLVRAWAWTEATGGAFDLRVGPLVRAWDLRGTGRRPSSTERIAALDASGAKAWDASALPGSLTRLDAAAALEEGGFGKGAGLDAALAALRAAGVTSARLDLGGQIAVLTNGAPERYAIAHPVDRRRGVLALDLESGSIATSGNSERGLVVDGARVGHLLDPRSGLPAADFGSVSVWCASALDADCLSTALYVLGPERALRFAHATDGVEAVVLESVELEAGGAVLRARATLGLRDRLHTLGTETRVEWFDPAASAPSKSVSQPPPSGPR